jgi:hypothetical protein
LEIVLVHYPPNPTIWVVEKSSGLPLVPVMGLPLESVSVKYGCPFCTLTEEIVPVTVDELLLLLEVPVFTMACFPINEAD